jgi:acyl-CoA thioesterase YciA
VADPAQPPNVAPTIRVTAMPADANAYGDIFGGWLMSLMDSAAGLTAARRARGRAVTIAMDGMQFHAPVHVGDEVSVYAAITRVGRTSMAIDVQSWARDRHREDAHKVTEARFTFVAIDEDRRPRPVPEATAPDPRTPDA